MNNWYFASGDLGFFWPEQIRSFSFLPQVFYQNVGFGYEGIGSMWLDYPFRVVVKLLFSFGLGWFFIEKFLWLSCLIVGAYSMWKLFGYVYGSSRIARIFSVIIYCFNTYILLLFGGGQFGVVLAYSFCPFVLVEAMKAVDGIFSKKWGWISVVRMCIRIGLSVALLTAFDLRFTYLMGIAAGLYALYVSITNWFKYGKKKTAIIGMRLMLVAIGAGLIVVGIHMYWILPILAAPHVSQLAEAQFTSSGMLEFLSVADFSHSLTLLHPNWPENLFGKVYFMQPEFLMLPVFVCFALLWKKPKHSQKILFFSALLFFGAFLAKGLKEPFGIVFSLLFTYIPGFVLFRDPTKFYTFVALSYAILLPYAFDQLQEKVKHPSWKPMIVLATGVIWTITIRHVLIGQVTGNFRPLPLPREAVALKDMLTKDTKPSRVLWVPQADRFAFASDIHPILSTDQLFRSASVSAIVSKIKTPEFKDSLKNAGVKYIVVPEDIEQRIFLNNYSFDPSQKKEIRTSLVDAGFGQIEGFGEIDVFVNPTYSFTVLRPPYISVQEHYAYIGVWVSIIISIVVICLRIIV